MPIGSAISSLGGREDTGRVPPASTAALPFMQNQSSMPRWVWLTCLGLTILKLWLTASQTVYAIGPSGHDDYHFLTQAAYMLRAQWLGPYDSLTLIKGPFFPAWIAFAFVLGLPLLLSAQLLYAIACWAMTMAVRPLLSRNMLAVVFYGVLLFNPASNAAGVTRVLREMITPALTTIVAACAFGLLLTDESGGRQARWRSVGLGASFAGLWLTREEQLVVVVPALLFVFGCATLLAWKRRASRAPWRVLRWWLGSLGLWAVIVYSVAAVNYVHYGLFNKTEFDARSFNAAYGALARVKPVEFKPLVPVSKETRRRIYHVSPAAAELKPYLEGKVGSFWETQSESQQDDSNRHEITGGSFMWALRDAVQAAGYYDSGRFPAEFYLRLEREVNAACARGELDCYGPRRTLLPVWHNYYLRLWLPPFMDNLVAVVGFRAVGLDAVPSVGTPEELALFRALAGEITPTGQHHLELEAAGLNSVVELQVKDHSGTAIWSNSSPTPSPDFEAYLSSRGRDIGGASNAHYRLDVRCPDECSLEMWASGLMQERIPFAELMPTDGVVEKNDIVYRLLSYDPAATTRPEEVSLSTARRAALGEILRGYQVFSPLLFGAALIAYGSFTFRMIRKGEGSQLWSVLTGCAILSLSRIALISFMNISSVRIGTWNYLYEAYPTMLAFAAISCLVATDRQQTGRRDSMQARLASGPTGGSRTETAD